MFYLFHTQIGAKYQCGEIFHIPRDNCPNHSWARIKSLTRTRVEYQCGEVFKYNRTPPDPCPNHSRARLESTWLIK